MKTAVKDMLFGIVAITLCWLPVMFATYDAIRRERGSFSECMKREWSRWWSCYMDLRG